MGRWAQTGMAGEAKCPICGANELIFVTKGFRLYAACYSCNIWYVWLPERDPIEAINTFTSDHRQQHGN